MAIYVDQSNSYDNNANKLGEIIYSLVIPVYNNFESLEVLLKQVESLNISLNNNLEVIFVVDGSPDNSEKYLYDNLPSKNIKSQLIILARNFGSFSAITAGMKMARGKFFAVMAADLQDPPELILSFFNKLLTTKTDIILGVRSSRDDHLLSKLLSNLYWRLYRKFIQPDIPKGGVDLFGFNSNFRNYLLQMDEIRTSLIGLIFWMGFKRTFIKYKRLKRPFGKSSWSFEKKAKYLMDSIYSFSDLPIKLVQIVGFIGIIFSLFAGSIVLTARIFGQINVPGYSATILTIIFFSSLNIFALSIISGYIYRCYENTKSRPNYIISETFKYN